MPGLSRYGLPRNNSFENTRGPHTSREIVPRRHGHWLLQLPQRPGRRVIRGNKAKGKRVGPKGPPFPRYESLFSQVRHAPRWYSEKERNCALAALRLPIDVLVELCALLEEYAYSREQHERRAIGTLQALGLLEEEATPKEVK